MKQMKKPILQTLFVSLVLFLCQIAVVAAENGEPVNARTIRGKVMCGYEGDHRCPGDGSGREWEQWSLNSKTPKPGNLKIEMWPDMSEFSEEEKYPVPGFTYPNGEQAHLYSSVNSRTVLRHFEWMREYEIDGIWLQRFLIRLPGGPEEERHPAIQKVLRNVREAAQQTGRVWAVAYDMALRPPDYKPVDINIMFSDWKKLVDEMKITEDSRYLHHDGKPVLLIWGFYPGVRNAQNITTNVANRIIDFFKNDPKYGVFLVGGGNWWWHKDGNREWAKVFRRFDAFCPWNIPTVKTVNGVTFSNTEHWEAGIKEARKADMLYIPVVWPGFSWNNKQRWPAGQRGVPRRRGNLYWEQWIKAARLRTDMVYIAMFDEEEEATVVLKVTNQPPVQHYFVGYEGLPSDWYLQLTREGIRMLRGQSKITREIPIKPDYIPGLTLDGNHPGEYIELFNGEDLSGWTCGETPWVVEDGALRNVGTGKGDDRIMYDRQLPGKCFALEIRLRVVRCANDYPRIRVQLVGSPGFYLGNESMKNQFGIYGIDLENIKQIGDDSYTFGDWYVLRTEVDENNKVLFYKDGVITHTATRVKEKPLKIVIQPGDGWSPGRIEISSIRYTSSKILTQRN